MDGPLQGCGAGPAPQRAPFTRGAEDTGRQGGLGMRPGPRWPARLQRRLEAAADPGPGLPPTHQRRGQRLGTRRGSLASPQGGPQVERWGSVVYLEGALRGQSEGEVGGG